MKKLSKQKKILMSTVAVFIITIVFAIAYAAFSQTLNINGNGVVRNSSWDIHFVTDSLYVENGYLKPSNILSSSTRILTEPSISNTTIGDYSVSLTTPGDTIEYRFDVINEGDYNAKISGFNLPSPTCIGTGENKTLDEVKVCGGEYNSETYQRQIEYTLKYEDGTPVSNNDTLLSQETKTLVLTLTYKEFNDANLLPANDITIDHLEFTINYIQDGNALVNEDGSTPYDPYPVGRQITIKGETYHILSSDKDKDYVVAFKDTPLTFDEVETYGVGHINQYTVDSVGTAYDFNGYGGMAYYTNENCGYVNKTWILTGCSNDYDLSDVKYVVDAWKNATFDLGELATDSNGYEARLITKEEYKSIPYEYIEVPSDYGTVMVDVPIYDWVLSEADIWTMTIRQPDAYYQYGVWFIKKNGIVSTQNIFGNYGHAVRPVINVYKSAIQS